MYRDLCQREQQAKAELLSTIEQSTLSESQKKSLFDPNNNNTCHGKTEFVERLSRSNSLFLELAKDIDAKQTHITDLMKKLLSFEKTFSASWEVVSHVIELNESKPTLQASRIVQALPPNFIERYQNAHSVSLFFLVSKQNLRLICV